jgi:gluconolactonase
MNAISGSKFFLLCVLLAGTQACSTQKNTMVTGNQDTVYYAAPVMVADRFTFTEGPAVDKNGNVFFTDQPQNKIWKYGTDGKLSVFMDTSGRSNGMYFDPAGNLISCADEHDQLWSVAPDGQVTVLVDGFNGARLNGPNDVWAAPGGGYYFTDPYYQRDYWTRQHPDPDIKGEFVYFLASNGASPVVVADDLKKPNGIVGTPDGKHLYIADIGADKTYVYDVAPDGTLTNKKLFAAKGSDGMTIDAAGNIYLTGKGVTIYNSRGIRIGHIPVPQPWTANVCFYGKKRNQLFITASKAVYLVKLKVRGVK